ncbi:GNAT family N-acetyltransferase [Bacillus sp. AK128]
MNLISKDLQEEDIPFFQGLIKASPEWEQEEVSSAEIKTYLELYQEGTWSVWFEGENRVGISYYVENAASNNRPWIGTVLVASAYRSRGIGKEIVSMLMKDLQREGHKVVYAAIPIVQDFWIKFLSSCGFEQYKIEKDHDRMYLLFIKPIE